MCRQRVLVQQRSMDLAELFREGLKALPRQLSIAQPSLRDAELSAESNIRDL